MYETISVIYLFYHHFIQTAAFVPRAGCVLDVQHGGGLLSGHESSGRHLAHVHGRRGEKPSRREHVQRINSSCTVLGHVCRFAMFLSLKRWLSWRVDLRRVRCLMKIIQTDCCLMSHIKTPIMLQKMLVSGWQDAFWGLCALLNNVKFSMHGSSPVFTRLHEYYSSLSLVVVNCSFHACATCLYM